MSELLGPQHYTSAIDIFHILYGLEEGIIPFQDKDDFTAALASLSPQERRKTKRKFRKLWRRLSRHVDYSEWFYPPSEAASKKPSVQTKVYRKRRVFREFRLQAFAYIHSGIHSGKKK